VVEIRAVRREQIPPAVERTEQLLGEILAAAMMRDLECIELQRTCATIAERSTLGKASAPSSRRRFRYSMKTAMLLPFASEVSSSNSSSASSSMSMAPKDSKPSGCEERAGNEEGDPCRVSNHFVPPY
jgi:hypothetical protein